MDATLLASNLGFPEGPVVMPDGSIVFCDGNTGELLTWKDDALGTHVHTGGSPWGAVLGSDGAIYVTQGGNVPGSPDQSAIAGIQRVNATGRSSCSHRASAATPSPGPTTSRSAPTGGCGSPTPAPSRTIASPPPTGRRAACSPSHPAATASS